MVKKPTVSICMPTLNCGLTVKLVLDTIKNLDYDKSKLEVIFVDGGSTDETLDILEKFREENLGKYWDIKIIKRKTNISEARNLCVLRSHGKYIFFVDSDVLLTRECLKRLLNHMKVCDIASIFYGDYGWKDPDCSVRYVKHVGMGCTMIKREVFKKIGLFNPFLSRGEDCDFCFRAVNSNLKILLDSTIQLYHMGIALA
ncbi:hypothetical protein DRO30_05640 [Candidatus Bathyarchaeota archaeon]|nr:MAG: hypothetical protein DRO30_05640 [Candidatus Bathyarchaeota archaeon]